MLFLKFFNWKIPGYRVTIFSYMFHVFNPQDPDMWREYDVVGFVVVYSITDRRSYQKALDLVYDIQCSRKDNPCTVILTANKSDLERSRMVGKQGEVIAD